MKNRYIGEPMNLLTPEEKMKQGIFALALPGFLKMNRPERQPGSRIPYRYTNTDNCSSANFSLAISSR